MGIDQLKKDIGDGAVIVKGAVEFATGVDDAIAIYEFSQNPEAAGVGVLVLSIIVGKIISVRKKKQIVIHFG